MLFHLWGLSVTETVNHTFQLISLLMGKVSKSDDLLIIDSSVWENHISILHVPLPLRINFVTRGIPYVHGVCALRALVFFSSSCLTNVHGITNDLLCSVALTLSTQMNGRSISMVLYYSSAAISIYRYEWKGCLWCSSAVWLHAINTDVSECVEAPSILS